MVLKKVFLRNMEGFDAVVFEWANQNKLPVEIFDGKESLFDLVEGLVILHTDHNILREHRDLKDAFAKKGRETHLVDIHGTLSASADSLKFWLENNHPKAILMVGSDDLAAEGTRLQDFLNQLMKRLLTLR